MYPKKNEPSLWKRDSEGKEMLKEITIGTREGGIYVPRELKSGYPQRETSVPARDRLMYPRKNELCLWGKYSCRCERSNKKMVRAWNKK